MGIIMKFLIFATTLVAAMESFLQVTDDFPLKDEPFVDDPIMGHVTFKQCLADSDVFTLNVNKSSVNPEPIVKGANLLVNVTGDLSNTTYVANILFEVESDDVRLFGQN